jgi:hypothetical protein
MPQTVRLALPIASPAFAVRLRFPATWREIAASICGLMQRLAEAARQIRSTAVHRVSVDFRLRAFGRM